MNNTSKIDGEIDISDIPLMPEAFFADAQFRMSKPEITSVIHLLQTQFSFLSEQFSIKRIGVFGSVVKDQAHVNSDIDLVVEFEQPLGFKFIELAEYLEQLFGRKVDLLTSEGIQNIRQDSVRQNILASIIYV